MRLLKIEGTDLLVLMVAGIEGWMHMGRRQASARGRMVSIVAVARSLGDREETVYPCVLLHESYTVSIHDDEALIPLKFAQQ